MSKLTLKVGDVAPEFDLPNEKNETVRLSDFKGKKNVILSFHPLAWTGICAVQMQDMDEAHEKLEALDTVGLGISVDSIPSKAAWFSALELEHVIPLADFEPKGEVAKRYGVYREENGFSERAVFVVDKGGVIRFAKVYPIKKKPDLQEILDALS